MDPSSTLNTQVLIVGAGPAGLVLALWLTRLGVRVRVIDKTAEPGTTSRALAVQARTLELYGSPKTRTIQACLACGFLGDLFLQFGQSLFSWYLGTFTNFNALYGVFGTIMGLLLWIYYTGVVLLLGGCISATTYASKKAKQMEGFFLE